MADWMDELLAGLPGEALPEDLIPAFNRGCMPGGGERSGSGLGGICCSHCPRQEAPGFSVPRWGA